MPPSRILDSHIHLWPSTSTKPTHHSWMTVGHHLAKQHGISDYKAVVANAQFPGAVPFIYIETDRYLPSPSPSLSPEAHPDEIRTVLSTWAKQPLEELKFLRRIVEEAPADGDGFEPRDAHLLRGAVIWAPFHLAPPLFAAYLALAQEVAGPQLWARVAGFRFLLQGKAEGEVQRLVESDAWLENVLSLGRGRDGKGWAFDVGVDTHRDGVQQLEHVVRMIAEVRRREARSGSSTSQVKPVRFVISKSSLLFSSLL